VGSVLSVTVGLSIGLTYGSISGFVGGWVDFWMMRVVDIILSLPGLLLTITIVLFLGPGLNTIALAIAIENVPIFARLVRSEHPGAEGERLRAGGALHWGVRPAHPPATRDAQRPDPGHRPGNAGPRDRDRRRRRAGYLGFGPQDPATPEWGTMLTDTQRYLTSGAAFTALFPGHRHHPGGAGLQPARGRVARSPRSEVEAMSRLSKPRMPVAPQPTPTAEALCSRFAICGSNSPRPRGASTPSTASASTSRLMSCSGSSASPAAARA
jgi:hypothetical protein